MSLPRVFNPDDYLQTPEGRIFSAERNEAAWEQIYSDLQRILDTTSESCLYVVMGVQGSGKTTWIQKNRAALGSEAVIIDAALPARRHRARALAIATQSGRRAIGVWIQVPLHQALAQNALRPADEVVPGAALRSVFSLLEPPSRDEGFDEVFIIDGTAG